MAILNSAQLADHYGKHRQTVLSWVRQGMPYVKKGRPGREWEFDSAEVAEWREEKAVQNAIGDSEFADEEELKRRKLAAEAGKAELELAKARREVAPLDEIENGVGAAFAEVRTGIRNIPSRVVSQLIGETDEVRFKQTLLAEIDQVLTALSETELVTEEEILEEGAA